MPSAQELVQQLYPHHLQVFLPLLPLFRHRQRLQQLSQQHRLLRAHSPLLPTAVRRLLCCHLFITKAWVLHNPSATNRQPQDRPGLQVCTPPGWRHLQPRIMQYKLEWSEQPIRWKGKGKKCRQPNDRKWPSFLEALYTQKKIGLRCTL